MRHRLPLLRRPFTWLWTFPRSETGGGFLLIAASMVALVWANSPWAPAYFALLDTHAGLAFGPCSLSETVLHWVNDGLMTLFAEGIMRRLDAAPATPHSGSA